MTTMTLTNMTFSNYTSKTAIKITTSGTYTFDNCLFDGSGSYEVEIDSGVTGDVTIVLTNGSTALTSGDINNLGSGNVTIQNSVTVEIHVIDPDGANVQGARVMVEADTGGALPSYESVTITRSGSTATVSHTAHGLVTGDYITIRGATQDEYNGAYQITVTTANAYTYTVSGSPATPATGTITSTARLMSELTLSTGIASETFNYSASQPIKGWVRKSSSSPYYKEGAISGSIIASGFSATVQMISDE